ncbi:hypothetical protein BDZ45DRAFT_691053 [Acephala macrosclerotiorum]|nr:hypothetical protein BDZ45DRAFT_691053 [Acephala macrosclerotiorum]
MVTPRPPRPEPLEEELDDNNSINVYVSTPKSSMRRKRTEVEDSDLDDEEQVVTPSPKKRKVLPVRAKDGEEERTSTRPVVEIPVMGASPKIDTPVSTNKKHRRFDSEEPTEEFFSTAPEKSTQDDEDNQGVADEEEIEDSEDDEPEAIGMQEAAETIKSREKDAAKAVKEQVNATKQKRKERDEALRKQSESVKKRKSKSKANEVTVVESDDQEDEDSGAAIDGVNRQEEEIRQKTTIPNSRSLPDLLPLEYLEDGDPEELLAIEDAPTKAPKNKKKSRDLSEKPPKDRRIGGTTYRVAKAQNTNLAPKAAFNARSVKESWLQGRSGKKVDPNRKPMSKGFFKK